MYSIALCTYNGARFIKQQLLSIVTQTVPPEEIIVCDDCSTDDTLQIVHAVADCYPDINWCIAENKSRLGYVLNFEQAINKCSMPFVFLSDQDDLWLEVKAETMIAYFECHPSIEVVFSNGSFIDEKGKEIKGTLFERLDFSFGTKKQLAERLKDRDLVTGATMAFRKSFVSILSPFPTMIEGSFIHDNYIAMMAALRGSLACIGMPLIKYRLHDDQSIGLKDTVARQSSEGVLADVLSKHRNRALTLIQKRSFLPAPVGLQLKNEIKYINSMLAKERSWVYKIYDLSPMLIVKKIPEFTTIRSYLGNIKILLLKKQKDLL